MFSRGELFMRSSAASELVTLMESLRSLRYCRPGAVYRPFFIFRVIWALDSFIFFVVLCAYTDKVHDPFWGEAVSGTSSGFLITAIIMLLLSVCLTILVDLDVLHVIRNLNFMLSSVIGSILVTLAFAFKGAFGTAGSTAKAVVLATDSLKGAPTSEGVGWFVDHYLSGSDQAAWDRIIQKYCETRTVTAGDAVLRGPFPALVLCRYSVTDRETGRADRVSNLVISGSAGMLDTLTVDNPAFANAEYLVNLLNRLSGRQDLIPLRPKSFTGRGLNLPRFTVNLLGAVFIFLIPAAILAAGIVVWVRRRRA
jgi:hypothetical protein